jgi:septal ring factor EnvC (AmiA/AmiB activator)
VRRYLEAMNISQFQHQPRAILAGSAIVVLWLLGVAGPALADPHESAVPAEQNASTDTDQKAKRERDLEALRAEQRRAAELEARLKAEVESIGQDRSKLNEALIDAAGRLRTLETQIATREGRIQTLDDNERAIRESLADRRAVIAEVLAALQRIGRRPPPALMVRPEDALQSVRTAMMLGGVLPEMRVEAEALIADLTELVRVRKEIAVEIDQSRRDLTALAQNRLRMTLLVEERQKKQAETERALLTERERAADLARQAESLQELIAKLEQDIAGAARRAEAARAAQAKAPAGAPRLAALKDPGRLAPAIAFASAKGVLPLPVNGVKVRDFGVPDRLGGTEKGLSITTRAGAQVTAPCDGWVVYAGPFRSYGQLLILNAGGGYHVLLAGMERISVDLGQFVLTGEPVAVMGGGAQTAALVAVGSSQPVLYVEFRKDGIPVDPGPWWATNGEKVRG